MQNEQDIPKGCELCQRELELTFHHFIPKKIHKRRFALNRFTKEEMHTLGALLCRDCHRKIHQTLSHKELGLEYNSLEALLSHPEIEEFVEWVSRQTKRVKR